MFDQKYENPYIRLNRLFVTINNIIPALDVEGVPPEAPALTGLDWSSSTVRDEWRIEGAHPSIECLDRERNGWRQVARGPKACILKWHGLECTPQHHRSGLCGKV